MKNKEETDEELSRRIQREDYERAMQYVAKLRRECMSEDQVHAHMEEYRRTH